MNLKINIIIILIIIILILVYTNKYIDYFTTSSSPFDSCDDNITNKLERINDLINNSISNKLIDYGLKLDVDSENVTQIKSCVSEDCSTTYQYDKLPAIEHQSTTASTTCNQSFLNTYMYETLPSIEDKIINLEQNTYDKIVQAEIIQIGDTFTCTYNGDDNPPCPKTIRKIKIQ